MSSILRLTVLAPGMGEAILAGRADEGVILEPLERPLPVSSEEERELTLER